MTLKRISGIILMATSIFIAIILSISVYILFTYPDLEGWMESTFIGLIFFLGFTFLLFRYGRKLFLSGQQFNQKKVNGQAELQTVSNQIVELEIKLERKEWLKVNFLINYTNPVTLFLTVVGFAMIYTVINFLTSNSFQIDSFPFIHLAFGLYILIALPLILYFQASNNLKSNKWLSEKTHFLLEENSMQVKGETFNLNINLMNVKSIIELSDWYIIYEDKQNVFFIPKNSFLKQEQENIFREMIKEIDGPKVKLKK